MYLYTGKKIILKKKKKKKIFKILFINTIFLKKFIYIQRDKMNKEEISNEKLKQIVDYQVNIFNII